MTYVPAFLRASFLAFLALASSRRPLTKTVFRASALRWASKLMGCLEDLTILFFGFRRPKKASSSSPRSSVSRTRKCSTACASETSRCNTCFPVSLPLDELDELADVLDGADFVEDVDIVDLAAAVEEAESVEWGEGEAVVWPADTV